MNTIRSGKTGEHPYGDLGQLILLVLFLAIWILDSFIFKFSTGFLNFIPLYIRLPLVAILFVLSGYFARSGLRTVFCKGVPTPNLITKGIFGYTRHPVYFGSILFYLSLVILTLSLASLFLFVIIFIFYNFIATFEEKSLKNKFGEEYLEYKKMVPKWIPGISSKSKPNVRSRN